MSAFLFLALNLKGWGETALGLQVAHELLAAGHTPVFLAPEENSGMFPGQPFKLERLSRFTRPHLAKHVDGLVARHEPAALVLCDLQRCQHYLQAHELRADLFDAYGRPLLAVDTWDQAAVGSSVDVFLDSKLVFSPDLAARARPLLPCPIVRPEARPGVYANLPRPVRPSAAERAAARARWGLSERDRALLVCTADWQQQRFPVPSANVQTAAVPRLLAGHVAALGPRAHLLHVGPQPFDVADLLGARYRHVATLPPAEFTALLGAVDLLLSLNVSATTMTRAIVSGLPVVLLHNSRRVTREDELPAGLTERVARWLAASLPLYPFRLWPLGWWSYLAPVLADNPYLDALVPLELLDEPGFVAACDALLDPGPARDALAERQRRWAEQVRALPGAREVVERALA